MDKQQMEQHGWIPASEPPNKPGPWLVLLAHAGKVPLYDIQYYGPGRSHPTWPPSWHGGQYRRDVTVIFYQPLPAYT